VRTGRGGEDGRRYGLLQLSDKAGGADFTAQDADRLSELAAFTGATLDAFPGGRLATSDPGWPPGRFESVPPAGPSLHDKRTASLSLVLHDIHVSVVSAEEASPGVAVAFAEAPPPRPVLNSQAKGTR
jgi:hypothetical protein